MILDKWKQTGLLNNCKSPEQEKELSELLETTANFIIERDIQDFVSSVMIPAIIRLFHDDVKINATLLVEELKEADKINYNAISGIDEEMEKVMVALENYKKKYGQT